MSAYLSILIWNTIAVLPNFSINDPEEACDFWYRRTIGLPRRVVEATERTMFRTSRRRRRRRSLYRTALNTCGGHFECLPPELTRRKKPRESLPRRARAKYSRARRADAAVKSIRINLGATFAARSEIFHGDGCVLANETPQVAVAVGDSRLDSTRRGLKSGCPRGRVYSCILPRLPFSPFVRFVARTVVARSPVWNWSTPLYHVQRIYFVEHRTWFTSTQLTQWHRDTRPICDGGYRWALKFWILLLPIN